MLIILLYAKLRLHNRSKVQLSKCVVAHLNVNDEIVEKATVIKYLRTWLDAQLSFKEHTTKNARQQ